MGHAIRAGNPRLARIDVSVPGFLAQEDLPPVKLSLHRSPCKVAALREETTSSRLSLEVEIDQFHLEEEGEARGGPVEISNLEGALDRFSIVHSPKLIFARVDSSSEEEEEIALNLWKGLKEGLRGGVRGRHLRMLQSPSPFLLFPLPILLHSTCSLCPN